MRTRLLAWCVGATCGWVVGWNAALAFRMDRDYHRGRTPWPIGPPQPSSGYQIPNHPVNGPQKGAQASTTTQGAPMFDDTRRNQKIDSRVEVAIKASEPRTGDRLSLNVLGSNRADCIVRGDQIATEFFDGMPYRRHILGTDYMGAASKFRMSLTYVVVEN